MLKNHFIITESAESNAEALEPLWCALGRKNFDITKWSRETGCRFPFLAGNNNLISRTWHLALLPYYVFKLALKLKDKPAGYIVTTGLGDSLAISLLNKAKKFKHLWLIMPEMQAALFSSKLLRRLCSNATLVAFSTNCQNRLEQAGFKNGKILLLPSYEPRHKERQENLFHSLAKADHPKRKFFTIGTITDLTPNSHIESILKAAKEALEVIPNLQVIIVGEGPEKKNLQWLAKQLGIESTVWFVGQADRAAKWLENLDLYIVSKPFLNLKNQVFALEIMDRRLPLIADGDSGLDDIIFNGKTGYMVNFKHTADLAETIIKLEQDFKLRERMGEAAQERVQKHFTIDRQLDQFAKIL